MTMKKEKINPSKIAFIRRTGAYGAENYITMAKLKKFAEENGLLDENAVIMGIAQDNPQITPPEKCRYDACLIVTDEFQTDNPEIQTGVLNGGEYAVLEVIHTPQEVMKAWENIFTECEKARMSVDFTKPVIERYSVKMVNCQKCELCVPLL